MRFWQSLRSFPLRRHLRRGRARWRLHRIEWNGRYRCLEPPKGYEKYYSMEEMFPGLNEKNLPNKGLRDLPKRLHLAWRLYWHHHRGDDEEMARFLESLEKPFTRPKTKEQMKEEEDLERQLDYQVDQVVEKVSKFSDQSKDFVQSLKQHRPQAEQLLRHRASVAQHAVSQFVKGYHEGMKGKVDWKDLGLDFSDPTIGGQKKVVESVSDEYGDFEIPHPDNLPVRYEAIRSEDVAKEHRSSDVDSADETGNENATTNSERHREQKSYEQIT